MAKLSVALLATLLCLAAVSAQEEECCADPDLGCFSDAPPYDHLPLPSCDFNIYYVLFTPEDRDVGVEFQRVDGVPSSFNSALPTVFIIHGYTNNRFDEFLAEMRLAFLDAGDYNVIIVGWGEGADAPLWAYDRSASNTRITGRDVALLTDLLAAEGAAHSDMWCVGYSLGAHTCGHAGREASQPLGRVTGLDPAGPSWEEYDIEAGINPNSADFVDIIHTNGKGTVYPYGQLRPLGDLDFYPNEGGLQPGCFTLAGEEKDSDIDDLDSSCSHGRAVEFFTESIRSNCFQSCSVCGDEFDMPEDCTACGGDCPFMGYGATPQDSGIYYLTTGSGSDNNPFCNVEC